MEDHIVGISIVKMRYNKIQYQIFQIFNAAVLANFLYFTMVEWGCVTFISNVFLQVEMFIK